MRRPALLHHELTASSLGNVSQSCIAPLLYRMDMEKRGKTLRHHTHTPSCNRRDLCVFFAGGGGGGGRECVD